MEHTVEASRTAVIVVDMWNLFPCETFSQRVDDVAELMNVALDGFRERRIPVLFMGEDVVGPYRDTRHFWALRQHENLIETWEMINHPPAPGRDTWWTGVCACEEPCEKKESGWTRIHDGIVLDPWDLVGGWQMHTGFIRAHGITTLLYCGVTTNICVLDTRNFSVCQSLGGGMRCILLEDLTEPMVPGETHHGALQQTFSYYRDYICPTVRSDLLRIDGVGLWHWYGGL